MFYLGDDYDEIPLIADVLELSYQSVNTSNIRITILYDGPEDGDSKLEIIDSPLNKTSRTAPLTNSGITLSPTGEIDMANKDTLLNYIKYIKKKAPAKKYGLYFGSHGTGFTVYPAGLAMEDTTLNDKTTFLLVTEIAEVLTSTAIDLVVFDACNMGNIENIYEFKNCAEYILASPEVIPGAGNNYVNFVTAAYKLSDFSAFTLGMTTMQVYFDSYSSDQGSLQQLYDVDKIAEIVESDIFEAELLNFKNNKTADTRGFNPIRYNEKDICIYYDLYQLTTNKDLKDKLDSAINIANGGIYKWLSIYLPNRDLYNADYENTKFATLYPDWVTILKQ